MEFEQCVTILQPFRELTTLSITFIKLEHMNIVDDVKRIFNYGFPGLNNQLVSSSSSSSSLSSSSSSSSSLSSILLSSSISTPQIGGDHRLAILFPPQWSSSSYASLFPKLLSLILHFPAYTTRWH